ncbi:MAG: sialidase family protein [Bacillota bacterium]
MRSARERAEVLGKIHVDACKVDVWSDARRYFHGPAIVQAPNGDWLVAFQDSLDHYGKDSVITQVRSRDRGKSWSLDGVVYSELETPADGASPNFGATGIQARNPAYGVTRDGKVILVVQRRDPVGGGVNSEHLVGSVYLISLDNGRNYVYQGCVDKVRPERHLGTSSSIINACGNLFMAAYSALGCTLYRSEDGGSNWRYCGILFSNQDLPDPDPCYPAIIHLEGSELVAQCCNGDILGGNNYQRRSQDLGETWGPVTLLGDLRITHHSCIDVLGEFLVVHGRQYLGPQGPSVVAYVSDDRGLSWFGPLEVERYGGPHAWHHGGYTVSIQAGERKLFIVYSSNKHHPDMPDIRGTYLRLQGFGQ